MVNLQLSSSQTLILVGANQVESYLIDLDSCTSGDWELELQVGRDAQVQVALIGFGELQQNLKLKLSLLGVGANLTLSGALYLVGSARVGIQVLQKHSFPNCSSQVCIRTALADQSQFNYQGLIWIGPHAVRTIAHQENKNILLSDRAQASSIPNLEVLNREVQCGHGSAIGKLDQLQLFYLQARGLDLVSAQRCLVQSFLGEVLPGQLEQIKLGLENWF